MTVLGVDGCRRGWAAVALEGRGCRWLPWTADIREVLTVDAAAVAIDIPIGLVEAGRRACDIEARRLLGRRGASVFAAPVRPVLDCATYAEARGVLAAQGGASMSAQAFGIVAAVRQVDAALTPADDDRVIEAHPEVAFTAMGGDPELPSKRTPIGLARRIQLLSSTLGLDVQEALTTIPAKFRVEDALDALACAWVARQWVEGMAAELGDGARDARGLPMRIVTGVAG